jgi:hypothetical protein
MKIEPIDRYIGSYRTGTISNYEAWQISKTLGFAPNKEDDPDKVVHSWQFTLNGYECAIWDYKGSHYHKRFSIYDPHNVLGNIFVIDEKEF